MSLRRLVLMLAIAGAAAPVQAQDAAVREVRVSPADGAAALADAIAGAGEQGLRVVLQPGRYVLDPTSYMDPSCGNCEDAAETVPTTLGLRVSGRGIEIVGGAADSVVIETGAGYGLLFEDCEGCALRNVTVTGGVRSPDGRATDAAVLVRRGRVELDGCVLRDNIGDSATVAATVVGIAGIAVREQGHAVVTGCRIVRNSWDGIALYRGARADITDNTVDGVDQASGARVGGGRGVGIGLTWDARARVERNLVRRYWKGIGVFVEADADVRENIVEHILTWGIALWGPGGSHPSARIEDNVIDVTGACGVMIDLQDGGGAPGTLTGNLIMRTGGNDVYDRGEPYCWQRPIARHNVPAGFVESGNMLAGNRQPADAGPAEPPLAELEPDRTREVAGGLIERLWSAPALRQAFFFDAGRDRVSALTGHAAAWQALLAAEDARAPDAAALRVLLDGTRLDEPELRVMAVRALGRLERPDLVDSIAMSLRDPAPRVRAAAANALAQTAPDDAHVLALLLDALAGEEEPVALAGIGESLGRLQHTDAAAAAEVIDRLRPHLTGVQATRMGVLRGLYFMARQPAARAAFDDVVRSALATQIFRQTWTSANDERARVVAVATIAAAGAPDAAVLDSVIRSDASPQVRREAVAGAALVADTAAAARLLRHALSDSAAAVRYEALRGWQRRLASTHGCAPFIEAAASPDAAVRQLAYDALGGRCGTHPEAARLLMRVVEGEGPAVTDLDAARALVALAGADPAAARDRLDRFAGHTDLFVRMAAARAAATLGDEDRLRAFAQDEHANVRTIAVQALAATAGPAATDVYLAQLDSDASELLMAAARALVGTADPAALPALLDALDRVSAARSETSRDGRIALLDQIRELGTDAEAARLSPYLNDFDPAVAAHVAETLTRWTGQRVVRVPRPLPPEPLPTFEEAAALENARFSIELEHGDVVVLRLLPFDAPANAFRFARLAEAGYFDGLTFHRVVPNFVVQGGSPGANEYSGVERFSRDELGLSNGNWRGTVGLSTRGRDTGDAQFYINLIDNVRLDHEYTVFAEVVAGMDAVGRIAEGARIRSIVRNEP